MGYSVMFWYIYTLYIDQFRMLGFPIISNISFFNVENLKNLLF